MPIRQLSPLEFNADKHFINRLLHSDGHQYALGVRPSANREHPVLWYVDHTGKTQYVKAQDLIELEKLPKRGTSPAMKIWCKPQDAPYAVRYEFDYAGQKFVKDTYALDAKYAREKSLQWLSYVTRKPFSEVHEYFNEHPHHMKAIT